MGAAHAPAHAGLPGAAHAGPPDDRRAAVAGGAPHAQRPPGLVRPARLGAHRVVVGGRRRVAGPGVAVRAHGPGGRGGPRCSCAASVRAATRGAAGCTCGCGRRSSSPRRPGRSPSPARRGSRTTRGPSGRRSARASTCTRSRPSPGCSRSATARPSSPRWTWRDGGSTATRSSSGASTSAPARPSARGARCSRALTSGRDAEVDAGSAVAGRVPKGERWSGSPAERKGKAKAPWPDERPPRAWRWVAVYGFSSVVMSCLPLVAALAGVAVVGAAVRGTETLARGGRPGAPRRPAGHRGGVRHPRPPHARRRAAARPRGPGGHGAGAQPHGLAGVGHRAAPRLRSHAAVPALRQPGHPALAASPRRRRRRAGWRRPPCSCCPR